MKRTIIAAAMLLVFACEVLSAQGPGRQRSRRGGDTRMQQDSSEEWAKAQAELKKKYPEKYKEIEKLQATNLFAAMEKMRELASEASVTLPGSRRGRDRQDNDLLKDRLKCQLQPEQFPAPVFKPAKPCRTINRKKATPLLP